MFLGLFKVQGIESEVEIDQLQGFMSFWHYLGSVHKEQ
jgi:hypothetical protein